MVNYFQATFVALTVLTSSAAATAPSSSMSDLFLDSGEAQLLQDDPRLIEAIRDRFLVQLPSVKKVQFIEYVQNGHRRIPRLKAQYGQPYAIEELFYREHRQEDDNRQRYFIEAGAFDGSLLSNSLLFELKYNWTGLLVEPDPNAFAVMKNRSRNAWLLPNCFSTEKRPETAAFDLEGPLAERLLVDDDDDNNNNDVKPNCGSEASTKARVQCVPFFSALKAIGNPKIDYFSLDVDGPELQILNTVPWDEVDITAIGIEVPHLGRWFPGSLEQLRNLMLSKGYKIYQKGAIDEIFVKKSFLKKFKK